MDIKRLLDAASRRSAITIVKFSISSHWLFFRTDLLAIIETWIDSFINSHPKVRLGCVLYKRNYCLYIIVTQIKLLNESKYILDTIGVFNLTEEDRRKHLILEFKNYPASKLHLVVIVVLT